MYVDFIMQVLNPQKISQMILKYNVFLSIINFVCLKVIEQGHRINQIKIANKKNFRF